jgi:hypothetical protein
MYRMLAGGQKQLVSLFDSTTDQITMVNDAPPVTMQAPKLHTSQQPPRPKPTPVAQICPRCQSTVCHCPPAPTPPLAAQARPPRIRTQTEAKRAVLAAMMEGVPAAPSTLDAAIAKQRELGLR